MPHLDVAETGLSSDIWHGALQKFRDNVARTQAALLHAAPVSIEELWGFYQAMGWRFTEAQTQVLRDPTRFLVLEIARRWGKTEVAIRRAIATMACRPGSNVAYIPRHRRVLERNWPRFTREIDHAEAMGRLSVVRRSDTEKEIRLANFSTLSAGSFDHATTWVGSGYDLVIADEAALFDPHAWKEVVEPAISDRRGAIMLISTPFGETWLTDLPADEVRQLRREARQQGIRDATQLDAYVQERRVWRTYSFPSWTNTFAFPEGEQDPEIKRLRRTLTAEDFMQQIMGIPMPSKDRIYDEFQEEVHCAIVEVDPNRPIGLGVDPSLMGANPYVVLAIQDFGDQLRVCDEYFQAGVLADHAISVLRQRAWWPLVKIIVIDDAHPAEVARWRGLLLPHEKIDAVTAKKADIGGGISLVKKWLRDPMLYHNVSEPIREKLLKELQDQLDEGERITPQEYQYLEVRVSQEIDVDQRRQCARIFVDHTCEHTIREFRKYKSRTRRDESRNSPEKPLDADDHCMDALRYYVWYAKRRYDPLAATGWWLQD